MSKRSVFCIATSRNRAEQIIANLRSAHFSSKDLSVVFASATEGGVEEVALAWPSGLGTLILAGPGRFTAAGPLLAALGGVAIRGTDGGMAASLIRLGLPVFEAQQYESRMKDGNILLGVDLEELGSTARAKSILAETYGENICIVDLVPAKGVLNGVLSAQPAPLKG